ncbi:Aldose 1-epimerase [Hondaea fermentalgiana]|uniref:Aldose 1-epimerase n=1 Tax=Hondaea fermentalgiana TaxID=2315210 RepID=A0A2R5GVR2_9STRA|nr:Aldose 1-epimerase [Hondaea fermentalgiana]|eukprot:GBG32753.1 Aldose 1-epimerase [Hondaea fermentalgiana]
MSVKVSELDMRCDAGEPPVAPARPPGKPEKVTIENGLGLVVEMATFGATLLSVKLDGVELIVRIDREVLPCRYGTYGGATIGRYANRIAKASFDLNGKTYDLEANNGPNSLHGGVFGFHRRVWNISEVIESDEEIGLCMEYLSSDGEDGFPGKLLAKARYSLSRKSNELRTVFSAELDAEEKQETIVNMCNHVYWNLSGKTAHTITDHALQMHCPSYIPVDDTLIPVSKIASVKDTPFEFREKPHRIGDRLKQVGEGANYGYDHCLCFMAPDGDTEVETAAVPTIKRNLGADFQDTELKVLLTLSDPADSGRSMTMATTQPGVQVYTANFMPDEHQHTGVALETENLPDAVNQRHKNARFPSPVLSPGEKYMQATTYEFSSNPKV